MLYRHKVTNSALFTPIPSTSVCLPIRYVVVQPRNHIHSAAWSKIVITIISYLPKVEFFQKPIRQIHVALKLGQWAGFSADIAYQYLYAWDISNDHALNERPAHHVLCALHYDLLDMFRFTVQGSYESKRRTEAWMSAKSAWMGGIFLLNAEIEFHIPHFAAYLRGTNLTDYNFARSYGFPEPGFQLTVGAKYTL